MIRALYTAASGMNAQQTNIDNIAHNLSNVNTTGFKKSRVEFEDLVYQQAEGCRAARPRRRGESPIGLEIGLGTEPVATARDFSTRQPALRPTRRSTSRSRDAASSRSRCRTGRSATRAPARCTSTPRACSSRAEGYAARAADHDSRRTPRRSASRRTASCRCRWRARPRPSRSARSSWRRSRIRPASQALGGNLFAVTTASGEPTTGVPGHRRHRHARAGLPRGVERQRGRGDGQHDPRPARLRGQLAGREDRR